MGDLYAKVYILDAPYSVDKPYDYYVPAPLKNEIAVGNIVSVPFGAGNKSVYGAVFGLSDRSSCSGAKPVFDIHREMSLNDEMLSLCRFLKEQTFCTIGDAVRSIIPLSAFGKLNDLYTLSSGVDTSSMNGDARMLCEYIYGNPGVSSSHLINKFGRDTEKALKGLTKAGILIKKTEIKEASRKTENYYSLSIPRDEAERYLAGEKGYRISSAKQLSVLYALYENNTRLAESELKGITGCSSAIFRALLDKKLITLEKVDVYRDPYAEKFEQEKRENILTPHQTEAFNTIAGLYRTGEPKAVLLHGITGSGKTRVIKSVIDEVIKSGKQAIIMVPEISLTPQTVDIFRGFYGKRTAVLHSSLSNGERYDAWRKIKNGEIDVCIGTRSAVFAPFERLGLIVMDEEQEYTYKSEMSPRYHARDIARFRAAYNKCLMLLASATPSLESYYKAQQGLYTLVELNERYGEAKLPEVKLADLRTDKARCSGLAAVGETLYEALKGTLGRHEQAILFINRRGYNNFISCAMCGTAVTCPHCSVSMTFHSPGRIYSDSNESEMQARIKNGWLTCHYCGTRIKVPHTCPECHSEHMQFLGFGTQRAEEELKKLFPDKRIMRMDADTTSTRFSFDDMLDRFRRRQADILIGTQMVTKGHDFPNVTCVGIILADTSLYLDDYRANERTFDLITQVAGRAGRSDKKGCAVIQTYNPDNGTLRFAAMQDYKAFYNDEILLRKAYVYPPFCDMLLITVTGMSEHELLNACVHINALMQDEIKGEFKDVYMTAFGPFEASVYKVNEKYRMQFVIKCKNNRRTREMFSKLLIQSGRDFGRKIQITMDMNPNNI